MSAHMDRRFWRASIAAVVTIVAVCLMAQGAMAADARKPVKDCTLPTTGLTPLTDLAEGTYLDNEGGLYPGGQNAIPPEHLALGLKRAAQVTPRLPDGSIDPKGVIGFLSIGVSNTQMEFEAFSEAAISAPEVNRQLIFVNGAQFGRALGLWASTKNDTTWERVDEKLASADVTPAQVQVAWLKLPSHARGPETLAEARAEIPALVRVLQEAKGRFVNLELVYVSSRSYGGYIDDPDSEPNSYNHGFEIKWLIEEQIMGATELNADPLREAPVVPWISWGPYLWADGTNPRSDGLVWLCEDFAPEGVHPAATAQAKVADMLMKQFETDPTAVGWFMGPDPAPSASSSRVTSPTATSRGPTDTAQPRAVTDGRSAAWIGVGILAVGLIAIYTLFLRTGRRTRDPGEDQR